METTVLLLRFAEPPDPAREEIFRRDGAEDFLGE
jgi:hypothetical protein